MHLEAGWDPGLGMSLAALADVLRAPDVAAGMAALGRLEAAFNWVLADADGSIGYQMSGLMPLRADPAGGLAPLPAWDPGTAWQGFAEPEELPRALNPEAGVLVTANDDLNHPDQRAPINLPMGDSRARRIAEELGARDDWTVAAVGECSSTSARAIPSRSSRSCARSSGNGSSRARS